MLAYHFIYSHQLVRHQLYSTQQIGIGVLAPKTILGSERCLTVTTGAVLVAARNINRARGCCLEDFPSTSVKRLE